MNVTEAVASRRAIRAFSDRPVERDVLVDIFEKAQWAPSGRNYQPWEATVLSGQPLREMQRKILAAEPQAPAEYSFEDPEAVADYAERFHGMRAAMYPAWGISRGDPGTRRLVKERNATSFGAPVLLLCHLDRIHAAPQWADTGMWLQTVMLLLREAGLDSCPQEFMSLHARLIKEHIGVSDRDKILFCGLAIGYRDRAAEVNRFERERVASASAVRFI